MSRYVAFILPGFNEDTALVRYQEVATILSSNGWHVVPVNIAWRRTTMVGWLRQFKQEFKAQKGDKSLVLGFSFGAMIAIIAAASLPIDYLLLCSLSPYFAEDLVRRGAQDIADDKRFVKPRRLAVLRRWQFSELPGQIKTKPFVFVGEKELELVVWRCEQAAKLLDATLVRVAGSGHDIANEQYQGAIEHIVQGIRDKKF